MKKSKRESIEMLQGNINRICITTDLKELDTMTLFAIIRIIELRELTYLEIGEMNSCKESKY